ncbi:GAF domain-containing protein [Sphingomonas kyeonggiensis]|uniref:GAF domain-containing protein n=1 Tax=Sphingomonas kyeonggiensis TaxID=1268553 RepID=A0A7W6NY40_9SPHN|nr:GAF domain-containing protein [Sphingomonas kyeonggiensis]MBB4100789.1 GAF domain-containing protein [Sphingomonas kyeonggiensis]
MNDPYLADVAAVQRIPEVESILAELCELTGMGFAAVARVTADRWIACQVLDRIEFGLDAGEELAIKTTICDEIRDSGRGVFINDVDADPAWRTHHTPVLYGLKSYISWPIIRGDGSFFGTLCAIDPVSRTGLAALVPQMEAYAQIIADELDRLSLEASR